MRNRVELFRQGRDRYSPPNACGKKDGSRMIDVTDLDGALARRAGPDHRDSGDRASDITDR